MVGQSRRAPGLDPRGSWTGSPKSPPVHEGTFSDEGKGYPNSDFQRKGRRTSACNLHCATVLISLPIVGFGGIGGQD